VQSGNLGPPFLRNSEKNAGLDDGMLLVDGSVEGVSLANSHLALLTVEQARCSGNNLVSLARRPDRNGQWTVLLINMFSMIDEAKPIVTLGAWLEN